VHGGRVYASWSQVLKKTKGGGYGPTSWQICEENCGSPTRRTRVATFCLRKGANAAITPLTFSLLSNGPLPPCATYFAMMDYKVPVRASSKQAIHEGCNLLLPQYMGHIDQKPVYDVDGPLKAMYDVLIHT
jgi:site-specific DNA-cytosine methylase